MKRFLRKLVSFILEDPVVESRWLIEEATELAREQDDRFGDNKCGEAKSRKVRSILMKRYPQLDKWYINLALEVAVGRMRGKWL